jgi:hypothetical protein
MALELRPNKLVGDHIYHKVIGHAGYEQIFFLRVEWGEISYLLHFVQMVLG